MFGKFKSLILSNRLSEKNINKQIENCFVMLFDRNIFTKDYPGIKAIRDRDDLRKAFSIHVHEQMHSVITHSNPHREFRQHIINNTKVQSTYGSLLTDEFEPESNKICNAINKGIELLDKNGPISKAMELVREIERFYDQPWGMTKIAHEYSWAEVEMLVLRHMQVLVFGEKVEQDTDWWGLYRKAYNGFITDYYNIIVNNTDVERGFPHPIVASIAIDALCEMENSILTSV